MAIELKVPTLGESISSGILAAWHVKDGDYVEKDQVVYELETDKITSEGLAEVAGAISLKVAEGDEVEIGQAVASIDDSAEKPAGSEEKDTKKDEDAAEAKAKEKSAPDESGDREKEAKSEEKDIKDEESESKGQDSKSNEDQLSPAARRVATEEGIDPSSVEGSGKGGRVTKEDLLATAESRSKSEEKSSSDSEPAAKEAPAETSSGDRSSRKRMSPMRRKIAQRLVAAQQQAAMLTTFNEADLSAVKALRAQYQDAFVKKHGVKLGFMSFFVKAVVDALQTLPGISSMIDGEEIVENHFYDIGIAVSTDKGLMVPVLRDCESLSLAGIEKGISGYAKKARDGKIKLEDIQGGVFTITNGGIFGSLISTPILNAPQSAILGMHAIQDRPIAVDGEVVIRPMMYLALSYDHRIVDGKEAVTFLVRLKQTLEDPTRLLLEV